jgi:hypothetical protein
MLSDSEESMKILARKFGCNVNEVRDRYIKFMKDNNVSIQASQGLNEEFMDERIAEAISRNIDPEDTVASFKAAWTRDYLASLKYQPKTPKEKLLQTYISRYPELGRAVESGDISNVEEFFKNYGDVGSLLIDELASVNPSPRSLLDRAVDATVTDCDYLKGMALASLGIELINGGFIPEESHIESYLYNIRAECKAKTQDFESGLTDINIAISLLLELEPHEDPLIMMFKNRAEINRAMGDFSAEAIDEERITQLYQLKDSLASLSKNDTDDDLTF